MSNVNSMSSATGVSTIGLTDISGMSPDAMLAYCQAQLSGLDDQVKSATEQQQLQLREREAVQNAQSVLEQFGTTGPQNDADFQKCVDALDQQANSLPPGDPVAAQLEKFKTDMCKQYGYDTAIVPVEADPGIPGSVVQALAAAAGSASLAHPPQNSDWQGTTDSLGNIADGIKSDAEIQMLQLQDLVSQRQQAVQLASGIMSKEDQTLESEAKAIGG
jgi:hypothetical protein